MIDINNNRAKIFDRYFDRNADGLDHWKEYSRLDLTKIEDLRRGIALEAEIKERAKLTQIYDIEKIDTEGNAPYQRKEAFRYCYTVGDAQSLLGNVSETYLPGIEEQPTLELYSLELKKLCLRVWRERYKEDLVPADLSQYRYRKDDLTYYGHLKIQPPPQDWSQAIYTDFPEFKPWWPRVTTVNG